MWAKLQVGEINEKYNLNRVFQNYMNRRERSFRISSRDRNAYVRYARKISSSNYTQIGSRAQLASYLVSNEVSYIRGRERAQSEKLTNHICLVPRLECVKLYFHSPHILTAWCLMKHRLNMDFLLQHL
jgi:hypothetical protein